LLKPPLIAYQGDMEYFDTHCHLDALTDLKTQLDEARDANITRFLLPAVAPSNWQRCIEISESVEGCYLALGIHPQCVRELSDDDISHALTALPELLHKHNAVAVGEIGLDWRWDSSDVDRDRQISCFEAQLDIAARMKLPPIIHCLDAHGKFLEIWNAHTCRQETPGIMHSYSGSAELVEEYVKRNLYISFSGAVTWSNAKRAPRACKATPSEKLLIETDAPYQPPHPGGVDNRLFRLAQIAENVASLRGEEVEVIQRITTANARRLLKV